MALLEKEYLQIDRETEVEVSGVTTTYQNQVIVKPVEGIQVTKKDELGTTTLSSVTLNANGGLGVQNDEGGTAIVRPSLLSMSYTNNNVTDSFTVSTSSGTISLMGGTTGASFAFTPGGLNFSTPSGAQAFLGNTFVWTGSNNGISSLASFDDTLLKLNQTETSTNKVRELVLNSSGLKVKDEITTADLFTFEVSGDKFDYYSTPELAGINMDSGYFSYYKFTDSTKASYLCQLNANPGGFSFTGTGSTSLSVTPSTLSYSNAIGVSLTADPTGIVFRNLASGGAYFKAGNSTFQYVDGYDTQSAKSFTYTPTSGLTFSSTSTTYAFNELSTTIVMNKNPVITIGPSTFSVDVGNGGVTIGNSSNPPTSVAINATTATYNGSEIATVAYINSLNANSTSY